MKLGAKFLNYANEWSGFPIAFHGFGVDVQPVQRGRNYLSACVQPGVDKEEHSTKQRLFRGKACALIKYAALLPALYFCGHATHAAAQDWGSLATISTTMGIYDGRICTGESSRGDIGCASNAPYINRTTGNVGIGLANPDAKLDISAGALGSTAGNSVSLTRIIASVGANYDVLTQTLRRLSNGSTWTTSAMRIQRQVDATPMGYIQFGHQSVDPITFGIGNTEYARINGGGISTTGTVTANAFIGDGSALTNLPTQTSDKIISGTTNITAYNGASQVVMTTGGSQRAILNNTGLSITGGASTTGGITVGYGGTLGTVQSLPGNSTLSGYTDYGLANGTLIGYVGWSNASGLRIAGRPGVPVILAPSETVAMTLAANGNVGIGRATPSTKLDVYGDINIPMNYALRVSAELGPTSEGGNNTWSAGTTRLIRPAWVNDLGDVVYYYTPGSQRSAPVLTMTAVGRVGINQVTPTESLDVTGNIKATNFIGDGSQLTNLPPAAIGNVDNITTRTPNGFWQTDTATIAEGWPANATWYHLLSTTHTNVNNYFSMQFAGDFFNTNNIFYRTTNNVGTTAWNRLWHAGNDGPASGLDADTVDGVQLANLVRNDANSGMVPGTSIRFGHANQTSADDGTIGAGIHASGLNIVGTQTVGGEGRVIRMWGNTTTYGTVKASTPVANDDLTTKAYVDTAIAAASGSRPKYMGTTPTSYNGSMGGPLAAMSRCNAAFPGSRMMTSSDIMKADYSTTSMTVSGWLTCDEIAYTGGSNTDNATCGDIVFGTDYLTSSGINCGQWNNNASSAKGIITYAPIPGMKSVANCNTSYPIHCVKD